MPCTTILVGKNASYDEDMADKVRASAVRCGVRRRVLPFCYAGRELDRLCVNTTSMSHRARAEELGDGVTSCSI